MMVSAACSGVVGAFFSNSAAKSVLGSCPGNSAICLLFFATLVLMPPGWTRITLTLGSVTASSSAIASVNPRTAYLLAL